MLFVIHSGQTGVERGAHEAAARCGLGIAGFMPREERDELGPLPGGVAQRLTPHPNKGQRPALRANLSIASAATIVVPDAAVAERFPAMLWVIQGARRYRLPLLICDPTTSSAEVESWVARVPTTCGSQRMFDVIGDVDVDEQGVWSSLVGTIGSVVGDSPEERAEDKVNKRGQQQFAKKFAKGIAVTVDLCSGAVRSELGHPPQGEMIGPARTIRRHTATLHRGGVILEGPVRIPSSGLDADAAPGASSQLVCAEDAVKVAAAFVDGRTLPDVAAAADDDSCPRVHLMRATEAASGSVDVRYTATETVAKVPPLASCTNGQ